MGARKMLGRLIVGLAAVAAVLAVAFMTLPGWTHFWGATGEEIARPMPGDEQSSKPAVLWTHGVTIDASPEAIWPWIAQIGDVRGGYYSYTLIENVLVGDDTYHNADRVIPDLQQPKPGDSLISGVLKVRESQTNGYLLGDSLDPGVVWTWVWGLYPTDDSKTRLVVRSRIQPLDAELPVVATLFLDLGGFVMEKRMMQGIKDRAEGRIDPPYQEQLELGLWLVALASGIISGLIFLVKRNWKRPLVVGIASMMVLLVLVFVQPSITSGFVLNAILLAGLGWTLTPEGRRQVAWSAHGLAVEG